MINLTLDKFILFQGDSLSLTASFGVPSDKTEVLLSVGVIRPDGFIEYPLYLQKYRPHTKPSTPPAPLQGSGIISYTTKLFGLHRAFAHIYVYSDDQPITEEMTAELWLLVLPIIPVPKIT